MKKPFNISFENERSEDFLETIMCGEISLKQLIVGDNKTKNNQKIVNKIFETVEKENNSLTADLVNKHLMANSEKYPQDIRAATAIFAGTMTMKDDPPLLALMFFVKMEKFDTLTDMVKDFHEDREMIEQHKIEEDEHEYLTLNYIGSIIEIINK